MSSAVVDASVAVKWFVPERHASDAVRLLRADLTLLSPDLIWIEVGNVLWKKWRAGELTAVAVQGILDDFRRFPLEIWPAEGLLASAWEIAQASGRTMYDSLYLALAVAAQTQMVTADRRLWNAIQGTPLVRHCLWVGNLA